MTAIPPGCSNRRTATHTGSVRVNVPGAKGHRSSSTASTIGTPKEPAACTGSVTSERWCNGGGGACPRSTRPTWNPDKDFQSIAGLVTILRHRDQVDARRVVVVVPDLPDLLPAPLGVLPGDLPSAAPRGSR